MRVFITGANGFVGTHLIRYLQEAEADAEVVAMVHGRQTAPDLPHVEYLQGDLADRPHLQKLIRQARPDHLYHLAGAASGAGQDHEAIFRVNVDGTRHVMEAAAEEAPLARILFISTGYVYGDCGLGQQAREDDPLHPIGLYAESKHAAEPYARNAGAVIARSFNHTGPGQTEAFVVPAFAAQIAAIEKGEQEPILHVGNLEAIRDFLDVRDVVRAYYLLMVHGAPGRVYNVCSGTAVTMQDLLDRLLAMSSAAITVKSDPKRMRPSDIAVSVGDPQRLRDVTHWQPEISLDQTLRDTLGWWRQQPAAAH